MSVPFETPSEEGDCPSDDESRESSWMGILPEESIRYDWGRARYFNRDRNPNNHRLKENDFNYSIDKKLEEKFNINWTKIPVYGERPIWMDDYKESLRNSASFEGSLESDAIAYDTNYRQWVCLHFLFFFYDSLKKNNSYNVSLHIIIIIIDS